MKSYFKDITHIINHEREFFTKHKLQKTKIDYSRLKRFVVTALRRFHELDQKFLSGLLLKVYKDVETLFDYANEFKTKTKLAENVLRNDFLMSIKEYADLYDNLRDADQRRVKYEQECIELENRLKFLTNSLYDKEEKAEHKKTKLILGDMAHNFGIAKQESDLIYKKLSLIQEAMSQSFLITFRKQRDLHIHELMKYANCKAFYLDKLLWIRASSSMTIKLYLATARIEGDYDTKTFIKYYLKSVNVENASDSEWHMYLVQAMKLL
jgi:hypothetical protein